MGYGTRLSAPWTDSRPHPRIANQLARGNQYHFTLFKTVVLRQHGEGAVIARCRERFTTTVVSCSVVVTWPTHREFKPTYFIRYDGYEEHDFVTGFQNDRFISSGENVQSPIRHGPGILELDGKRYGFITERRIKLSQHES
jgi:hypothetical protein